MPSPGADADAAAGAPLGAPLLDEDREVKVALRLALVVLLVLTAVKPLGGIPWVGAAAFTFAAMVQLYLPLWRIDRLGLDHDFIGLHTRVLGRDLRLAAVLAGISFPPYIVAHYLFMTRLHGWALGLGMRELASMVPQLVLRPHLPGSWVEWGRGGWWLVSTVATHGLGVALPEETFYRGYLQPRLERRWTPSRRVLGVPFGGAAVGASGLFALGHFLGEWNPLRLGPFLPGLVFAWQRNATGSVIGAIVFHAACNVLGELLATQYAPF